MFATIGEKTMNKVIISEFENLENWQLKEVEECIEKLIKDKKDKKYYYLGLSPDSLTPHALIDKRKKIELFEKLQSSIESNVFFTVTWVDLEKITEEQLKQVPKGDCCKLLKGLEMLEKCKTKIKELGYDGEFPDDKILLSSYCSYMFSFEFKWKNVRVWCNDNNHKVGVSFEKGFNPFSK